MHGEGFGVRVLYFRFRCSDFGFWLQDFGLRASGFGCQVLGFRASGLGCQILVSGLRVMFVRFFQGFGCQVLSFGITAAGFARVLDVGRAGLRGPDLHPAVGD